MYTNDLAFRCSRNLCKICTTLYLLCPFLFLQYSDVSYDLVENFVNIYQMNCTFC